MSTTPIASPDQLLRQPKGVRFALWLLVGRSLGLPVDEMLEAMTIQLAVAKRLRGRHGAPFTDRERMRLAGLARAIGTSLNRMLTWIVSPEALIRWLKRYQERQAQGQPEEPRRPGRPRVRAEIEEAVLRIYRSGLCGLGRIRGELRKCGIEIAESTIRTILDRHALPPSPDNGTPGSTWASFLRIHAPEIIAIDFIQVATGLWGAVRYSFVLFGIEHDTRRVHLLGVTEHPTHEWLQNVVRTVTMDGEALARRRYWIHDNDGKFQTLRGILKGLGHKSVNTSIHAPDMNHLAERFIGSARRECLDHAVFLSEDHLRRVFQTYLEHYNTERPHQGIGNVTIGPWSTSTSGEIVCDERLGGLLKSFRRAA
jgi:putative transposase